MDDSSSTCSTDSVPSVVMNVPYKGNSIPKQKSQKSPNKGRNQRGRVTGDVTGQATEMYSQPSEPAIDVVQPNDVSGNCKAAESESEAVLLSLQDQIKRLELDMVKKEEEVVSLQRKLSIKDQADMERSSKEKTTAVPTSPRSHPKNLPSAVQLKSDLKTSPATDPVSARKPFSSSPEPTDKAASQTISSEIIVPSKADAHKAATPKPTEKPMVQQVPVVSRPSSAPLIPGPRPTAPVVSMVQTTPLLARSVSAAGRLGPDPLPVNHSSVSVAGRLGPDLSPANHSYVPSSYRNAMMGNPVAPSSSGFTPPHSPSLGINRPQSYSQSPALASTPSSGVNRAQSYSQSPALASTPSSGVNRAQSYSQSPALASIPMFLPKSSERTDSNSSRSSFSFMVNQDVLQNGPQWVECPQSDTSRNIPCDTSSVLDDIKNLDLYKSIHSRSQDHLPTEFPACTSGRQTQGILADEFPHLDIINDLLEDEHGVGKAARVTSDFKSFSNGPHHLNRQFTFPGNIGMSSDMDPSTSSGRFERTRSYLDDGFQSGYGSSGVHFDSRRDMVPQANQQPYANGQIEGLIPNQWQMAGSDLSFLSMRQMEGDGYAYQIPDYSNLAWRRQWFYCIPAFKWTLKV
ncbi:hypothetical protein F0562_000451 [Nyssa sinensis]|uniref:Uncharacterized protein n=1 Tax=Nyssa sinensis TaxID=561372 RepID=A0A5J5C4B2_9ASTE|nr:hypothetical protein F0562_000451 [Nyssa sinensis]